MSLTKPQKRLLETMKARQQFVHHLLGGGWRLFDGTPVHHRTVESLAKSGVLAPAANDLFGDRTTAYRIADHH
ncbi:hypothetical protein [Halomonas binhaiensis]|uniref:Uncharacterized protein n=1 Tax=Halomonas binhaiensis TaxID=2562282 RepID=A0A5C1NGY1_9GAMM|nr:hypothetical protein [Halomonas binhaiensis]QEM81718.1 hypothetical protein E4T21_09285 [Halomonas binhaiensis]